MYNSLPPTGGSYYLCRFSCGLSISVNFKTIIEFYRNERVVNMNNREKGRVEFL